MIKYNTRFAPSPNGYLHLGHAYSAFISSELAKKSCGKFFIRIEDIDLGRCKKKIWRKYLQRLKLVRNQIWEKYN